MAPQRPRMAFGLRLANLLTLLVLLTAAPALAVILPQESTLRDGLAVQDPGLYIANAYQPLDELDPGIAALLLPDLAALEVAANQAFYDLRAGAWGTLVLREPLIPGPGSGNSLTWADLGLTPPADGAELEQAVWSAFEAYLASQQPRLGVDPDELGEPRIAVHDGGRLIQIWAGRVVGGVEVRDSYVSAAVNSGNLVLYGSRNWGPVATSTIPLFTAAQAEALIAAHVQPGFSVSGLRRQTALTLVPTAVGPDLLSAPLGQGYDYRLAWAVGVQLANDLGSWLGLVDAHSGELFSFVDTNSYFQRRVVGGVFPISNDGIGPEGTEQPGYPMPFADLILPFGTSLTTNAHGLVEGVGGDLRTALSGPFVRINDLCGDVEERALCSDLDLGDGPGTDCDVPATADSLGNTHSARSGFYEVNRLAEMARGILPDNDWLGEQLTANMNIPQQCNAFWDGSTINFFRSALPTCRNTGEIAAIFDHEWGHGLDDNDNNPDVSTPGEAIADVYGVLRLADSCMGRGFFVSDTCGGYGDPCVSCTGVRDLDFAGHASGVPHDIQWILAPTVGPGGGCAGVAGTSVGPCGQETHCEGYVAAEAGWDLYARDLQAAPDSFDLNTALELATRLFFLGGHNVGNWYQCAPAVPGFPESQLAGCVADGGYMNVLAADDDNGDLTDGTPHMEAIFNAFNRHQIACGAIPVANSGCAGGPTAAPSLSVLPLPGGADLSWSAVPGATEYWVYRTEGVTGCDFGKIKIAETTGTSYTDTGLLPGFDYYYGVLAVGTSDACTGPMSSCEAVVPTASAPDPEARLAFREVSPDLAIVQGDGDPFVDNCELVNFNFQVENAGSVDLTNVELVSVTPVSHPATDVLTPLPRQLAASLAGDSCGLGSAIAAASFSFQPRGLSFDDTLELAIVVGADSALGPVTLSGSIFLDNTESDFEFQPTLTWSFEQGLPPTATFDGWSVISGVYTPQSPGAAGTVVHLASSTLLAGQCDEIRSPEVKLTPSSNLTLWNQFTIEPGGPLGTFDRANVGLFNVELGARTTIEPDGGRTYNASGPNGVCVTADQPGWAGAGPGFLPSTWSSSALGAAGLAGQRLQLDVAYGTDGLLEGNGFQFDEVTLTDFDLQVADKTSDDCPDIPAILANDDSATTAFETAVTINVLANDFAVEGPLTVFAVDSPTVQGGSAIANGDGTVTYTPPAGFSGGDSFAYTVQDAVGNQAGATVLVTVTGVSLPPECTEPGPVILVDPAGDALSGLDEHDVLSLSISQPAGLGGETFVFTLQMASLANPPPNTTWPVTYVDHQGTERFVRMATDPIATVTFAHGLGTNPNPTTNPGTPADPSSSFDADGTIRIVVAGDQIGNPQAGDAFNAFLTRIRIESPDGSALTPDNMPDNFTGAGSYTVANCGVAPPDAMDDFAATELNVPVNVAVLANDITSNPPLTVASVTQPVNGAATIELDDTVTYTPDVGFLGTDSFTYTACDGSGLCDTATVEVTVSCPATASGAFSDDFEPTPEAGWTVDTAANNNPASVPWTAGPDPFAESPVNSFFSDATTLDLKDDRLVAPPVNLSSTSRLVFWHRFGFENTFDGGVLEVSADGGNTWVDALAGGGAFVEGGYNGVIDATFGSPIAGRAAWTGASTFINANDRVEVDLGAFAGLGRLVRWRLAADPLAPGAVPGQGWWIDDVQFTDLLAIPPECPFAPEANDDTATTQTDVAVAIDVLANDFDANGDPLTVGDADPSSAEGGTVTNNGGDVTYDPPPGFVGVDTFTYEACDPGGLCSDRATVTVTVTTPGNRAPEAEDDTATTPEDTPVIIDVVDNDDDPDGDPLTVTSVQSPTDQGGTAVDNGDGTVTYTPAGDFFGTDTFTYTVCDDGTPPLCDSAVVTVTVEPVNDPPVAQDDAATTPQDTAVTVDVVANDADPEENALTVTAVQSPTDQGGTAVDNGDGTVTYTPPLGFIGIDTFGYTVCDDGAPSLCDTATVTVNVTEGDNQAPVAEDDAATTEQDTPVTVDVLANDSDPDGDTLTVTDVGDPADGTAVDNGDGTVTYTPDPGFVGTDSFGYEVCDPGPLCDTATVTVVVQAPSPTSRKITGGGWIPGPGGNGKSNFGFNAHGDKAPPKGRISYQPSSGGKLKGTVLEVRVPSDTEAEFSGPCDLDGAPCTYTVFVEDNGEPGTGVDRFRIEVRNAAGATIHQADDLLGGGNIQIH